MRTILVHADATPAFEARLQASLDIARARSGHVTLHCNTPLQRFVAMDPFGGAYLLGDAVRDAQAREAELTDRLSERLAGEDVSWSIESSTTEPVDGLALSARLADIVVVTMVAPLDDNPPPELSVSGLTVGVRCPVLAIPSTQHGYMLAGTAMVAWDRSFEASNALRSAAPLLALADKVEVVSIAAKDDSFPETDVLSYLARYGIEAQLSNRARTGLTVEETLDAVADELAADWMVLGAFGHSRLRETMFGGVTRYFLDTAKRPLLLAH
jgi:nucleotide-binding universal stress UspA family protein